MTGLDGAATAEIAGGRALSGTLPAPTSKSLTNRALITAALAEGTSVLRNPLDSDDSAAMQAAVAALGARVSERPGALMIEGTGGTVAAAGGPVDARLSGTTMRFVAALAALAPAPVTVTGSTPLLRRPLAPLTAALRALGATVEDNDGFPPVTVSGGLAGGEVAVDVSASSQFASAVLLVAPYAGSDVVIGVEGQAADAYIDMTIDLMRRWGAEVAPAGQRRWRVTAGAHYRSREEAVEYDASAAAHLLGLAAATGGDVTVTNAVRDTLQPDAQITHVLRAMGCQVAQTATAVTVTGPERLAPLDVDLGAMPDQVTTVAVLAALADGTSVISGAGVTRGHETDRLAALAMQLRKVDVEVHERPDGLLIHGGSPTGPARLATYDDHRLAMAFAALAARVPGVQIEDPSCVAKTYPRFWDDLARLGGSVRFRP